MRRLGIADLSRATSAQARALIVAIIEQGRSLMGGITRLFGAGKVTLAAWAGKSLSALAPVYYGSALVLTPDPTSADVAAMDRAVSQQAAYLARFRDEIKAGKFTPTDPATGAATPGLLNRADLYPQAAWTIAHNVERFHHIDAGYQEERRILGAVHSCRVCLDESRKGWSPIGSLRIIGDSPCRVRCRCVWQYRR